ncbi:MAG: hypothetical protein HQK53_04355 [Oligoflexia bacterium]|nr:hypothetical protein [Oligoflexia bacterium]
MNEQQRYEQQLSQLDKVINQTEQKLRDTQKEKLNFQQQYQFATYEKENLKTQLDKLTQEHESTTKELASSIQSQQHWQGQHDNLLARWNNQNRLFLEEKTQYRDITSDKQNYRT